MIDKIINEWTYQLDSGYPTKESDYEILRTVLQETNMLSEDEIDRTVRQAQGIVQEQSLEINDEKSFENFILSEYAMQGQQFLGLGLLYQKINESPNRDKLLELITDLNKKPLQAGDYKIEGISAELYQLISQTVKVPNGHYSELWFAIKFNGEVKGGVAGESIVSDVDVDSDGVSL